MSDKKFMYVCDIVNPKTGLTYREENRALQHIIPVGALVEIVDTGVRLFVVRHNRDCDETPLYCLCHDKSDTTQECHGFSNRKWVCGYPEESIRAVK